MTLGKNDLYLEKLKLSEKIDDLIKVCQGMDGTVKKLEEKVGIQNGRIAKLENDNSFLRGMGVVISLLVVPIFLYLLYSLINIKS